jgi:hypothetical protein
MLLAGPRAGLWLKIGAMAAALGLAGLALIVPNTFTNRFVLDAFYLLNAGYVVYNGFVPHIDFPYQFGGYETYLIAAAFSIFGVGVKGIEQGITIGFLVTLFLLFLGTQRQARTPIFILLVLLVTAVSITRSPFEDGDVEMGLQSFSMYYNRICWALSIVVYSTLLLRDDKLKHRELLACAVAGFLILTTKLTFVVLLAPALIPLLMRNGGRGVAECVGYALAMALLAWIFLGYGPAAYLNSYTDLKDVTAGASSLDWALRKLGYVAAFNTWGILVALAAVSLVFLGKTRTRWMGMRAATLVGLLLLALLVTVTTGSLDYFISATTPVFAFIAILGADDALGHQRRDFRVLAVPLALYVAAFSLPHVMNYLSGLRSQARGGELSLFQDGPLRGLAIDRVDGDKSALFGSVAQGVGYISARSALEGGTRWFSDYDWGYVLADGVALAKSVPDIRNKKIATFYHSMMPFALQSRPAVEFPLLPVEEAASMKLRSAIPPEIDVVMLLRHDRTNPLHARFRGSIERDFELEAQSPLWLLYIRSR